MKKVYLFDEIDIIQIKHCLESINHDADVIQQNKAEPSVVNGYAQRIITNIEEVLSIIK